MSAISMEQLERTYPTQVKAARALYVQNSDIYIRMNLAEDDFVRSELQSAGLTVSNFPSMK